MSEDKLKRRRFLADLLFVGGGLTTAALVGRWAMAQNQPEHPVSPATPAPSPTQDLRPSGEVALPATPSPAPSPRAPVVAKPGVAPNPNGGARAPGSRGGD